MHRTTASHFGERTAGWFGAAYRVELTREFRISDEMPGSLYFSAWISDLCGLLTPGESLTDSQGECYDGGKELGVYVCKPNSSCVGLWLATASDFGNEASGFWLYTDSGSTDNVVGPYARPLLDAFPGGVAFTVRLDPAGIALWVEHSLLDGIPSAAPTFTRDTPTFGPAELGQMGEMRLIKTSGHGEPAVLVDDLIVTVR